MEQAMPWRRATGAAFVFHVILLLLLAAGGAFWPASPEKETTPLELSLETTPQPLAAAVAPSLQTASLFSAGVPSASEAPAATAAPGVVQVAGDLGEVTAAPSSNAAGDTTPVAASTASPTGGSAAATPTSLIRPQVLQRTAPDYPSAARARGEEGTVLLRVEILPTGRAGDIAIARSSGSSLLDDAARQAVASWRFTPAKDASSGRALACVSTLPVSFRLQGGS